MSKLGNIFSFTVMNSFPTNFVSCKTFMSSAHASWPGKFPLSSTPSVELAELAPSNLNTWKMWCIIIITSVKVNYILHWGPGIRSSAVTRIMFTWFTIHSYSLICTFLVRISESNLVDLGNTIRTFSKRTNESILVSVLRVAGRIRPSVKIEKPGYFLAWIETKNC